LPAQHGCPRMYGIRRGFPSRGHSPTNSIVQWVVIAGAMRVRDSHPGPMRGLAWRGSGRGDRRVGPIRRGLTLDHVKAAQRPRKVCARRWHHVVTDRP
jgi:hypothetical protein